MLVINDQIEISDDELSFTAVRAGGPGGQNVNKVSTAICLQFDYRSSTALPAALKTKLDQVSDHRISKDGIITINAREHRSQEANRRAACTRLVELLQIAAKEQKPRKPTGPSAAARKKRRDDKLRRSKLKASRGKPLTE